jgi:uncharacterized protein YaiI (UPF0178 family)
MTATTIYVDADACPVKDEAVRVAERHGLAIHFVSNAWMRLPEGPLVHRVVVSDGPDAADDWIASRIGPDDVAVTADIPLAARCLKTGARVIGPTGKPSTQKAASAWRSPCATCPGTCAKRARARATMRASRARTDRGSCRPWRKLCRLSAGRAKRCHSSAAGCHWPGAVSPQWMCTTCNH